MGLAWGWSGGKRVCGGAAAAAAAPVAETQVKIGRPASSGLVNPSGNQPGRSRPGPLGDAGLESGLVKGLKKLSFSVFSSPTTSPRSHPPTQSGTRLAPSPARPIHHTTSLPIGHLPPSRPPQTPPDPLRLPASPQTHAPYTAKPPPPLP